MAPKIDEIYNKVRLDREPTLHERMSQPLITEEETQADGTVVKHIYLLVRKKEYERK